MRKSDEAIIDLRRSHPGVAGRKPMGTKLAPSPKQYELRLARHKVYELMCMKVPLAKIAVVMGKPESTIRLWMKQIQADFTSLVQTDEALQLIAENLSQFDIGIGRLLEIAMTTNEGDGRKESALKGFVDAVKKKAEYQVLVGKVRKAPEGFGLPEGSGSSSPLRGVENVDDIVDEISEEDLDAVWLTVADHIRKEKQVQGREVAETPPLVSAPLRLEEGQAAAESVGFPSSSDSVKVRVRKRTRPEPQMAESR